MRILAFLGCIAIVAGPADASDLLPKNTDTFMISRDGNEKFRGSHRVFTRQAPGLVNVEYCGHFYWVRPVTVAWTQLESEANRQVRIEWNWGKGWRPVCNHAEKEVTLADIGIHLDAGAIVATQGRIIRQANRFSAIMKSFRPQNTLKQNSSFHRN